MNRRRVGLAALVIGAGAVVRQRLKTQTDPGVDATDAGAAADTTSDLTSPSAATPAVTHVDSPPVSAVAAPDAAGHETDSGTEVSLGDPEIDGVVALTIGDPEIDGADAASLGDSEVDIDAAVPSTADQEIGAVSSTASWVETAPGLPAADTAPTLPTADTIPAIVLPTLPAAETIPPIVLPTMPAAGTRQSTVETIRTTAPADTSPETVPVTPLPLATTGSDSQPDSEPADVATNAAAAAADVAAPDTPQNGSSADSGLVEKEPFHRAHRGWSIAGSIFLALVVAALIAGSLVRLPYYSLEPGSVYDTIERVEAPGDLVSIPNGEIGFVTVSQTANITPWQWLDAKLDNNVRIRHEDEVRGDQTADELRAADIRRMTVSKNSAVVVALQKLGFDLVITPIGIEVAQVFDCTAADGTLGTGDLIVGVNGVEVLTGEQLVSELMDQSVGTTVDLLVERIDPTNPTQSMRTDLVAVTLGSADAACLPDDVRAEEPRPFIGIGTLPMFDEEFPIDIDVRTGTISGPSAGLAFTLAIMDVLSEGELTNGLSVVATGSIDRDGNVGPVGGIHQKTVAAERSGADVFIVPRCCDNFVDRTTGEPLDLPGNYEEALLYADDMIVIGVDTLDEALIALGELGGDVEPFLVPEAP